MGLRQKTSVINWRDVGRRLHRRTSTFTATSPGGSNPGLCALLNEPPLELGEGREDVEDEFARWSGCIDGTITN